MSTIIKASGPQRIADGAAYKFEEMADRAKDHLEQARRQAAEIVTRAEQDAVLIRRQAEEQSRASALEAIEQLLDERIGQYLTTLSPALEQAIEGIRSARAEWLLHWEKTAVHVAAAIAGRVIRRELSRQPEIALALVKEALELAAGCGEMQLRMHPEDVAALGPRAQQLTAELGALGKAEVVADARITRGGCRIETRFGSIDQQFEAQLARIEEELT